MVLLGGKKSMGDHYNWPIVQNNSTLHKRIPYYTHSIHADTLPIKFSPRDILLGNKPPTSEAPPQSNQRFRVQHSLCTITLPPPQPKMKRSPNGLLARPVTIDTDGQQGMYQQYTTCAVSSYLCWVTQTSSCCLR